MSISNIINIDKFLIVLSKKNIIRFFKIYIVLLILMAIMHTITYISVHNSNIDDLHKKIESVLYTDGYDMSLLCSIVGCKEIVLFIDNDVKNIPYTINSSGILVPSKDDSIPTAKYFGTLTDAFDTIINRNDLLVVVSNASFFNMIINNVIINVPIFTFIFIIIYIKILIIEEQNRIVEKSYHRIELENKLQRDITESLHHEMGMPVALLKSLINEMFIIIFPCKLITSGKCEYILSGNVNSEICNECDIYKSTKRRSDILLIDYHKKFNLTLERVDAVIAQAAASKHIKYSNGNTSLFDILDNVISTINNFKVSKISATYVGHTLFLKYAVGYGMMNGDLLNIIHAHVTNSIEAKATNVTFRAELLSETKLNIFIQDDGRGIRDKSDNVIKTDTIFRYGYSSKNMNGETIVYKNYIISFLDKMGLIKTNTVPRGSGLSTNKEIAIRAGGDITLIDTSAKGTTFKLTIPIKIKQTHND